MITEREPVTEERLAEIEAAGGVREHDWTVNETVLDLVAEIRRLRMERVR